MIKINEMLRIIPVTTRTILANRFRNLHKTRLHNVIIIVISTTTEWEEWLCHRRAAASKQEEWPAATGAAASEQKGLLAAGGTAASEQEECTPGTFSQTTQRGA